MATDENGTGTVAEATAVTEATETPTAPEATAEEELVARNRHQTIVPVDGGTTDTEDVGPAENRHQTVLPAD